VDPLAAPVLAGALGLGGTLVFIGAYNSEPPTFTAEPGSGAWRIPAMWVVIASSVLIGVVFGSVEVGVIAFAQHHGAAGLAGLAARRNRLGERIGGTLVRLPALAA